VLGPIGDTDADQQTDEEKKKKEEEEEETDESVYTSLGLVNAAPVTTDQPIDEPVTSGGDAEIYIPDAQN
jgi:hypothetical protein